MGILLGLATALAWGSADLCSRFATRKIGTLRTMLFMQLCGLTLLTILLPLLGGWGHLGDGSGLRPWVWGILAGCLNTSSTLALYRSFEVGKMSIVAPLSASYPVLTVLLSLFTGERLTTIRIAGMVLTILGVILVARGETIPGDANQMGHQAQKQKQNPGIGWALYSAFGFGVMFWLLGIRIVPIVGAVQTVWVIRLISVIVTALVARLARQSMEAPSKQATPFILSVGVLDTAAYVFNNWGMRLEQISVVSVLASLYGAVTVGLAALLLKERVSNLQWSGIIAIFLGIILISL